MFCERSAPKPSHKASLDAYRWTRIAPTVAEVFNAELRAKGLPTANWGPESPLAPHLGKELTLLAWAVEDADPTLLPAMIANWLGLAPEERWWLYTTINAACVRRLVEEACNEGNLAVLATVLAPASATAGADVPAWAGLRNLLAAFRAAVPDARWTIVEQISQRHTVVTRLVVQGTFSGPLLGLAPPGRPATLTGVAISRFAGGRLVELWLQADLLGLLVQVGVLPPLDLAQAVAMAQVARAGALLAGQPASALPAAPGHGVSPDA